MDGGLMDLDSSRDGFETQHVTSEVMSPSLSSNHDHHHHAESSQTQNNQNVNDPNDDNPKNSDVSDGMDFDDSRDGFDNENVTRQDQSEHSRQAHSDDNNNHHHGGLSQHEGAGTSTKSNEDVKEFLRQCNTRAYIDGRFFSPDLEQCTLDGKVPVGICQICPKGKRISASFQAPSNFVKHLQTTHESLLEEYDRYVVEKRAQNKMKGSKRNPSRNHRKNFQNNLGALVNATGVSYGFSELPEFRKLISDLPLKKEIKFINRRTLTRRSIEVFDEHIAKIKSIITKTEHVCLTVDMWSTSTRRFIGMTIHWIDKITLQLKSAAITCRRFPGLHSYDRIAQVLKDIQDQFGLTNAKVVGTVTDNASNLAKAFREFGIDLEDHSVFGDLFSELPSDENHSDEKNFDEVDSDENESTSEPDDDLSCEMMDTEETDIIDDKAHPESHRFLSTQLRCIPHTFNLIATTDLQRIISASSKLHEVHTTVIDRCMSLWKILRSPTSRETLYKILGEALRKPTVVRWNSFFNCLSQIVRLRAQILTAVSIMKIFNGLRPTDFRYLEEYVKSLAPIAEAIDQLQGDKNCTYGYLVPVLLITRNQLTKLLNETSQYSKPLVKGLFKSLETRFSQFFKVEKEGEIAVVAAMVHPKFKGSWLGCLTTDLQKKVRDLTLQALENQTGVLTNEAQPSKSSGYLNFGCNSTPVVESLFGKSVPSLEFNDFLKDPREEVLMLNNYPKVRRVFIEFNTLLPSSAPVEPLFSYANMMNLPMYNLISDQNFERRVISRANSKKTYS